MFQALLHTLFGPRRTFSRLANENGGRSGRVAMVGAGVLFGLFNLWLYLDGRSPSFTGVPIPRAHYYLAQALFVTPLLVLAHWIYARVVGGVVGVSQARRDALSAALGLSYGVPLAVAYIIPDAVAYAVGGFNAMLPVMRISAPLCLGWILVLSWWAVGACVPEASRGKTTLAIGLGFLAQAVPVVALLR